MGNYRIKMYTLKYMCQNIFLLITLDRMLLVRCKGRGGGGAKGRSSRGGSRSNLTTGGVAVEVDGDYSGSEWWRDFIALGAFMTFLAIMLGIIGGLMWIAIRCKSWMEREHEQWINRYGIRKNDCKQGPRRRRGRRAKRSRGSSSETRLKKDGDAVVVVAGGSVDDGVDDDDVYGKRRKTYERRGGGGPRRGDGGANSGGGSSESKKGDGAAVVVGGGSDDDDNDEGGGGRRGVYRWMSLVIFNGVIVSPISCLRSLYTAKEEKHDEEKSEYQSSPVVVTEPVPAHENPPYNDKLSVAQSNDILPG